MKKKYIDRLKTGVVLFDGAMGTMLYDKGVFVNRCFEETNLSMPGLVMEIHNEMIEAGAQVITTNSFGANSLKLKGYTLADKCVEINKKAVRLAKEAAGEDVYVAASIGPLGVLIEPMGKFQKDQAIAIFKEQIQALLSEKPDLLIFESFTNLDELLLAVSIAKKLDENIPVQAQFSLRPYKSDETIRQAVETAVALDQNKNTDIIGINCTVGPAYMLDILKEFIQNVKKPVSIMPNAGFPKEIENRQIYMASPDYFAEYGMRFHEAGASIIGGCCGTTPAHIEKMGKAVLSIDKSKHRIEFKQFENSVEPLEEIPLEKRSELGRKLVEKEWITSVELVPPMGINLEQLVQKSMTLKTAGVDCINLPDGPRASSRISALVSAIAISQGAKIEPVPHICSRDRNLIALQSDMLASQAMGIHNLLFITGDPPKVGNYPDVTGVFDVDALGLISLAKRLNQGVDLGGKSFKSQTSFVIGAGANPVSPFPQREIERTLEKAKRGADYFITQPIFDAKMLIDFIENVKSANKPFIAGIWPLASYRNALFMQNEVPGVEIPESVMKRMEKTTTKEEALEEGISIMVDIIAEIKPYVAGVQISPPFGKIESALEVLKRI